MTVGSPLNGSANSTGPILANSSSVNSSTFCLNVHFPFLSFFFPNSIILKADLRFKKKMKNGVFLGGGKGSGEFKE